MVLAPTDAAFNSLLASAGLSATELLADTKTLADIVLEHVTVAKDTAATMLTSLLGEDLTLGAPLANIDGSTVATAVNKAMASGTTDCAAEKQMLVSIDTVLLPKAYAALAKAAAMAPTPTPAPSGARAAAVGAAAALAAALLA